MEHNRELTYIAVTAAHAQFQIGGFAAHKAYIGVDKMGAGYVAVFEGCGQELHVFDRKMGSNVLGWLDRAAAGEEDACDLLREVATEGLKEIRTLRAEPLMLKPTTATMLLTEAGRVAGGPQFGPSWRARLDADGSIMVRGPLQSREECISHLHQTAGFHGFIVTRIIEKRESRI
jgi:hypothetical protein